MNRTTGSLLLEVTIAASVIAVGLLGFLASFLTNFKATGESADRDDAARALSSVTELLRNSDFDTLYANFNGTSVDVPELYSPAGGTATVQIECFVNETSLPAEFGPLLDIDSVAGLSNTDCSTTYKLLPMRLSLSYLTTQGPRMRQVYVVLGPPRL